MKSKAITGFIGVFVGIIFMIGMLTPLPTTLITGVGVGIMSLSILSPSLDLSKPKLYIVLIAILIFISGVSLIFVGLITPLSLITYGLGGLILVVLGFSMLVLTARKGPEEKI